MSMQVTLERDGHDQPWGFRLQGGVDVSLPLSVMRVLVGSPAESILKKGDVVTKIGQTGTHGLTHQQAADLFNCAGNQIVLTIKRSTGGGVVPGSSQPSVSALQASAAIRQQQQQLEQQQSLASDGNNPQSPQVAALPRTTFVLKSDLPPPAAAPLTGDGDDLSVRNQPYRTLPLVQPSAKVLQSVGSGSYSHLKLQEDICSGVREPQLVPITPAQAQALKANDYIMKQKVSFGVKLRSRSPDPSVSIRSLLRPTPLFRRRPAWKDANPITIAGRGQFRIGGQMVALKPAKARVIPGVPLRSVGGSYAAFKPKPLMSPAMWKSMLKATPIRPVPVKKVEKKKRVVLPEIKLRKEKIIHVATRDRLEEYCDQVVKEGLPGKKYKIVKNQKQKVHEGVVGPATMSEVEVKFLQGKRQIQVTIVINRFEEYEDFFTVGDKNNLPPGPCASFTFSMDYMKNGEEEPPEFVMPEKTFETVDVEQTINVVVNSDPNGF